MPPEGIAAKVAPAEPAAPAPAAETPPAETPAATPVKDGEPGTPKKEAKGTPGPSGEEAEPTGAEKRIRRVIAEREEAKRDAAYWRGKAEAGGAKPEPTHAAAPPPIPLTAEAYEVAGKSYDDLLIDKAAAKIREENAAVARATEEVRRREASERSQATFMERINRAAESDPDLMTIVQDRTLPINTAMAEVIRESEHAPKLLRMLSENRAEALRIANLSPLASAREIGRMEAKVAADPTPAPPKRITQAPEPIKPLAPEGALEVDMEKMPIEDFIAKRNAAQFGTKR